MIPPKFPNLPLIFNIVIFILLSEHLFYLFNLPRLKGADYRMKEELLELLTLLNDDEIEYLYEFVKKLFIS